MRFAKLFAVWCAAALLAGTMFHECAAANRNVKHLLVADGGHPLPTPPLFAADGGHPLPTPPLFVADGGHPLPTPPLFVADGGHPLPTPPLFVADGGHPLPTPPLADGIPSLLAV
jgi:hypothetical protein